MLEGDEMGNSENRVLSPLLGYSPGEVSFIAAQHRVKEIKDYILA